MLLDLLNKSELKRDLFEQGKKNEENKLCFNHFSNLLSRPWFSSDGWIKYSFLVCLCFFIFLR